MAKIYLQLIFISSLIVLCASCTPIAKTPQKSSINYLIFDEKPDSISPASFEEIQFKSSGSVIFGFQYIANGSGPHPTVVLLHGLPGNERNLDIAQNLRRAGYNIIYFDYRGSWGSEGNFSFANSLNDISAVLDYLTDSQNQNRLKIDTNRIALIGHSMGAGLALINGLKNPRVKAVAGISVFNPYTILKGSKSAGNILSLNEYMSTLGMLNCEPDSYTKELLSNVDSYNIENMIKESSKPILIIDEHKNNIEFKKYTRKRSFTYKMWNTDHAFTNKRIALSIELNAFLLKNLSR